MNDGAVTPTPLVQSLGMDQLNCRRLWSRDVSIHDGFIGLVSCLEQLDLQVLCVQETQSPPMWINLFVMMVLLAAMVAKRVSCSTLPLWRPLSLGPLTLSLFVGASSQALCVSAHSTRHMLDSLRHSHPVLAHTRSLSPPRLAAPLRHPTSSCRGLQHFVPLFPTQS